jgi:hypothetical protein
LPPNPAGRRRLWKSCVSGGGVAEEFSALLRKRAAGEVFLRTIRSLSTANPEPVQENKIHEVSYFDLFSGFPPPLLSTTAMLYSTSI